MKRLPVLALATIIAGGVVATALAQGGGEPTVRTREVLHLPAIADGCTRATLVNVRVTPPVGVTLAVLRVRAGGREVVRLTGVAGPASVRLRLPNAGARVTATGVTLGGQDLRATRLYRRCPPPAPKPPAPPPNTVTGGGSS